LRCCKEYKKLDCRTPNSLHAYLGQALSYAHLGRMNDARAAVAKLFEAEPDFSLEVYKRGITAKGTDPERDIELLHEAGLTD